MAVVVETPEQMAQRLFPTRPDLRHLFLLGSKATAGNQWAKDQLKRMNDPCYSCKLEIAQLKQQLAGANNEHVSLVESRPM